jgi:hypothetical protein
MDRVSYHDACNDLAVAIGSVRAFLDGKLDASRANLDDVLQSLEHVDVLMAQARAARPSLSAERETMLQAIVEGSPYAKVLVDAAGHIVFVNAQTEALFGYAREELLGQPIEMLVPQRLRPSHPALRVAFASAPSARAMGAGRTSTECAKTAVKFRSRSASIRSSPGAAPSPWPPSPILPSAGGPKSFASRTSGCKSTRRKSRN